MSGPAAGTRTVGRATRAKYTQTQSKAHQAHGKLLSTEAHITTVIDDLKPYVSHPKLAGLCGDLDRLRKQLIKVAQHARSVADGER
ncbi:hypothetical protein GS610_08135 [Ruegeria sp. HKCCD6228]|uniref:hypothetical protein n=1 Tax=Ruegeria sp. HKCCD6228 TaxID=2683001 RepID=UPI001491A441|nr:hypothetical protein [Ruegeria sp. HKCCD6228]NOD97176.1 hypothetical protein [Ruegeria sp. HKCCD6228]